jgi:hypothetical protein
MLATPSQHRRQPVDRFGAGGRSIDEQMAVRVGRNRDAAVAQAIAHALYFDVLRQTLEVMPQDAASVRHVRHTVTGLQLRKLVLDRPAPGNL